MEEKILKIKESLNDALSNVEKEADILNIKSEYIGKKSEIQGMLTSLKDMEV